LHGSSTATGVAGVFDYNQTFVSDPTAQQTGHCAIWSGTLGPHGAPATQGFGVEITASPDGNGYLLSGYVGDKPLTGSIKNIRPGVLAMERDIGNNKIIQTIQLG